MTGYSRDSRHQRSPIERQCIRLTRALLLAVAVLAAASALAGCGGGERVISTPSVVTALRHVGFRNLAVFSSKKAYEQLDRRLGRPHPKQDAARNAADEDVIYVQVNGNPYLTLGPLVVARAPSAAIAKKDYDRGYSPSTIRSTIAQLRKQHVHVLPPHFDLAKLTTTRICNLILASYNAADDPALTARYNRAVRLLRSEC